MKQDHDEDRMSIPLDPMVALRGLLAVDPDAEPSKTEQNPDSEQAAPEPDER